jgi:hypothetical protein
VHQQRRERGEQQIEAAIEQACLPARRGSGSASSLVQIAAVIAARLTAWPSKGVAARLAFPVPSSAGVGRAGKF